jgi:hypothetical protein
MLHACVQRFDVTDNRGNILGWDEEVNKALASMIQTQEACLVQEVTKLSDLDIHPRSLLLDA